MKSSKRIKALFFCLAVAESLCHAQTQPSQPSQPSLNLTIENAVEKALEGNRSLKQGQLTLAQKKRSSSLSWSSLIPSIRGNASLSNTFSDKDTPTAISIGGSASVTLTPSLYTAIKGASLNYEQQKISYETAVTQVELNVRKLFYSLLFKQSQIEVLQSTADSAQKRYESNQTKFRSGTLAQMDVLNSQITWQNAKLSVESAKMSLENDLATFKQLLGIPQETLITLSGNLEDVLSIGAISIEGIEAHSANVASYEKQLEIAKNALLATRFSAWGPSISASYNYTIRGDTKNGLKNTDYGTFSLSLSIPLDGYIPWTNGGQSIANQKDAVANLEMELDNARMTQDINIQSAIKKIEQTQDSIQLRKSSVTVAQQSYDMTLSAYNHGTRDLLTLQSASDNLQNAKMNLLSDALNLITAILDLENTLGVPFGTLSSY
jgi:outer membrane protein TolC